MGGAAIVGYHLKVCCHTGAGGAHSLLSKICSKILCAKHKKNKNKLYFTSVLK